MRIKSNSKLFGWLFKILNTTPFDGELLLKFELLPNRNYLIDGNISYLNRHNHRGKMHPNGSVILPNLEWISI